ncbi:MAG: hypothetical protein IPL98_03340 [Saprospiraceae bacterium]|nr:hypothetical protein [Saprospiraceae bacterium]
MKKLIIIFLLLQLSFHSIAQDVVAPDYVFCEIIGHKKQFNLNTTISLDIGQKRTFLQDDRMRNEETGELIKFSSMIDALNFMTERGWEFVQAYVIDDGSYNYKHWILKRRLSEAEKKDYKAIKE